MSDQADLAAQFQAARRRLVGVAYAILGSYSEAEDVVADTWIRLAAADRADPIRDVEGWAIVAVSRGALDAYRSARRRREVYVGPWLPEPLMSGRPSIDGGDPSDRVALDDTVSFALLVVLESLSPAERTAWVMHDLFGLPFAEVAQAVGRRPDAVRQLASRARAHLAEAAPRFPIDSEQHERAARRFIDAAGGGSLADLIAVLDPQVTMTADGGGVVTALRRPVVGADNVARVLLGIRSKIRPEDRLAAMIVNGATGLGIWRAGLLTGVIALTTVDEAVVRVDMVRAPAKLRMRDDRG